MGGTEVNTSNFRIDEIQDAVDRYLHIRQDIDAGDDTWASMANVFTDDVVYVDPAWGRIEGIVELREFLRESMAGLEDWRFPVDSSAISRDRAFIHWTQVLPVSRPDGTPYQQSGMSLLVYGGGGKFRFAEDILNMAHVVADLKAGGWTPGSDFASPPRQPNRDATIPSP
jgi:hypothetical protein